MRVICIDDNYQGLIKGPSVKKGNMYTVIAVYSLEELQIDPSCRPIGGKWYFLAEMPQDIGYHESLFLPINEDQQDETEMERDYNIEKTTA